MYPERDFSVCKNAGIFGGVFISGGYCYKIAGDLSAQRQISAAEILKNKLGKVEIPDMEVRISGSKKVISYRLIEGETLADFLLTASEQEKIKVAAEVGEMIAKMHSIDVSDISLEEKRNLCGINRDNVDIKKLKKCKEKLGKEWDDILDELRLYQETDFMYEHPHLVHTDLNAGNMIIRNGHLVGLVDLDSVEINANTYLGFSRIRDEAFEKKSIETYCKITGHTVDIKKLARTVLKLNMYSVQQICRHRLVEIFNYYSNS